MWSLRFLNGPRAGDIVQLKPGPNILGRADSCDITISNPNISKEHARIDLIEGKITITDLNSRNGTFINGVLIKSHQVGPNDKIMFDDLLIEITNKTRPLQVNRSLAPGPHASHPPDHRSRSYQFEDGNSARDLLVQGAYDPNSPQAQQNDPQAQGYSTNSVPGFIEYAKRYVNEVVLPGVYKLAEWLEFRWLIGLFVLFYVVIVTAFSVVPLVRILKDSIERESQNRARTIARNLANENRQAIAQDLRVGLSVSNATSEPGVDRAFIISAVDGQIMVPHSLAGRYPDAPFVQGARQQGGEVVKQINSSTIGALVPIQFLNPNTGANTTTAYAVIIYNMGSLAVDDRRTLALFIQVLFLALVIGFALYFFLIRIIEHPIEETNQQLNQALKDGSTQIETSFLFPQLQNLVSNINSAVSRIPHTDEESSDEAQYEHDRSNEITNLVGLIGFPACAISPADQNFLATNEHFNFNISQGANWTHTQVSNVLDQSLRENLLDLVHRSSEEAQVMASNDWSLGADLYTVTAQAVYGSKEVAYILIVFLPQNEGAE